MPHVRARALLSFLLLVLAACDTDPPMADAAVDASSPDAGPEQYVLDVQWETCPLFTEGIDERAECAEFEVPLHWSDREGERIVLFLKRYRGEPGGGQAWFLTGGPGQAASDLEPLVDQLIGRDPTRSYYLLDHRGVGRSTRLRCEGSEGIESPNSIGLGEGEIAACLEEVRAAWTDDQLAGFSTVNAAHDLGQLIGLLRVDDETVSLWGGSYGTLWLERYLGLYPEQPDAAVFSALALDVDLLSVDRYVDDVTRRWLDACDADAECGERFQATFSRRAREVVSEVFSGPDAALCPEIAALDLDVDILKPFFGQIFGDLQGRSFYAPMVYRIARCEPRDVAAMENIIMALSPPPGPPQIPLGVRQWGFVLSENIAVSELTSDLDAATIEADYANAIAVQGPTPRLIESRALWPRYDAPPFSTSDYQGAVLMLHGEYDFLPEAAYQRLVDHYLDTNPNADFVLIPGGPHSLESPTTDGQQCGLELILSRLYDPSAPVSDCTSRVEPLRFAPPPALSTALFGTDDPWDGVPGGMGGGADASGPSPVFVTRVRTRASSVHVLGGVSPLGPAPRLPTLRR
ncbi:MAG: alpha/beta fold hydrolase [Sandaracinaceae bacterium]